MKENEKLKMTGLIIMGVIVLTLIIIYSVYNFQPRSTMNVDGIGEVEVTPDEINLNFNIEKVADTSKEATNLNLQVTQDVKNALILAGFSEEDIKTTNFNVYEEFDWSNDKRESLGYKATQTLTLNIPIEEKDKVNSAINSSVDNGAMINYIHYSLSDELEEQTKSLALNKATKNAQAKAEEMTTTLSSRLGRIIQITDSYDMPYYRYATSDIALESSDGSSSQKEVSFNPNEQTVSSRVSILYEIK